MSIPSKHILVNQLNKDFLSMTILFFYGIMLLQETFNVKLKLH